MTTKLFYMTTTGNPIMHKGMPLRTNHNEIAYDCTMEFIVDVLGYKEHNIVVNIIDEMGRIVGSSK